MLRSTYGDIPRPGRGRPRRRRGARFRGGLLAAAEVADAAPATALRPEGPCCAAAALPRLSDTGSETAGGGAAALMLPGFDRLASTGRIEVPLACSRSLCALPARTGAQSLLGLRRAPPQCRSLSLRRSFPRCFCGVSSRGESSSVRFKKRPSRARLSRRFTGNRSLRVRAEPASGRVDQLPIEGGIGAHARLRCRGSRVLEAKPRDCTRWAVFPRGVGGQKRVAVGAGALDGVRGERCAEAHPVKSSATTPRSRRPLVDRHAGHSR